MESAYDAIAERRLRPVPKGKRAFAMKPQHRRARSQPRTHRCCILASNHFGVWSQPMQRYVRSTRYLRFAKLGWELVQFDKICRALIHHAGLFSWEEYAARREELQAGDAVLKRLYFEYAPEHLKRNVHPDRARQFREQREAAGLPPLREPTLTARAKTAMKCFV
ncbi:unnamed protein product [Urochloa decumbens]|uniref:Uncharacterized protein n=1 Tax=Urochloa decumbens TaxID=240449 RepID=A0ABC8ZVR1_9POAL